MRHAMAVTKAHNKVFHHQFLLDKTSIWEYFGIVRDQNSSQTMVPCVSLTRISSQPKRTNEMGVQH